jgi:hypothetical protein
MLMVTTASETDEIDSRRQIGGAIPPRAREMIDKKETT